MDQVEDMEFTPTTEQSDIHSDLQSHGHDKAGVKDDIEMGVERRSLAEIGMIELSTISDRGRAMLRRPPASGERFA